MESGVVLSDCWALDLKTYTWERVKKTGIAPGPRSGFSLAVHRTRAVLFGAPHVAACVDGQRRMDYTLTRVMRRRCGGQREQRRRGAGERVLS